MNMASSVVSRTRLHIGKQWRTEKHKVLTAEFPKGSEWRKWDLHVHAPGTKLSDGYGQAPHSNPLDDFCRAVHESDVGVIGVTDYFSMDTYFQTRRRYYDMYPNCPKLLLPNVELRLSYSVNRESQEINLHMVFNPNITEEQAEKFLSNLKTTRTVGNNRAPLTCSELTTDDDFQSASVDIGSIDEAISNTFGSLAISPDIRQRYLLVLASAKGDGIRSGGNGIKRKNAIQDEIDKYCDAIFGNQGNVEYYLSPCRYETEQRSIPKPVFGGCDAHSFEDLKVGLGRHLRSEGNDHSITWVKADPTYEGLLQTLVEPSARVSQSPTKPDEKDPYRVITGVSFSGTDDFPERVEFNPNLNAIIGSRSSGKSTLLAHIAHSISPEETERAQLDAAVDSERRTIGPAANYSWDDVSDIECTVSWASGEGTKGKVVYVPQNALYSLSERPGEITQKIQPVLFRDNDELKQAYDSMISDLRAFDEEIERCVNQWFENKERDRRESESLKDLGDSNAVKDRVAQLQAQIDDVRRRADMSEQESADLKSTHTQLRNFDSQLESSESERSGLLQFFEEQAEENGPSVKLKSGAISVEVSSYPKKEDLPTGLSTIVARLEERASNDLRVLVEEAFIEYFNEQTHSADVARSSISRLRREYAELLSKESAVGTLDNLNKLLSAQEGILGSIDKHVKCKTDIDAKNENILIRIKELILLKESSVLEFVHLFNLEERRVEELQFFVDTNFDPVDLGSINEMINRQKLNPYLVNRGVEFDFGKALADPSEFLVSVLDENVRLKSESSKRQFCSFILTLGKMVRFGAILDGDSIGGFGNSSMTPGKQALFGLSLILNEADQPWPLLIDQPEDDLDSRSIYDTVVPYLIKRKSTRQIIMVSHNANLVIGADSESVIVANRNGADSPNRSGRTFDYLSGSLEFSRSLVGSGEFPLERCGIREHACLILDGGEEAFRKRKAKYSLLNI